jgi:hypothetical protein
MIGDVYVCAALPRGTSHSNVGRALRQGLYRNFHTHESCMGGSAAGFEHWVHRTLHGSDVRHGHITVSGWSGQVLEMIRHADGVIRFHDRGEVGRITGWFRAADFEEIRRPVTVTSDHPALAEQVLLSCRIAGKTRIRTALATGKPLPMSRRHVIAALIANQDAHALALYRGRSYPSPDAVITAIRPCLGPFAPEIWLTSLHRRRARIAGTASGRRTRPASARAPAR